MRKIAFVMCIVLLIPAAAFAGNRDHARSSGEQSADAAIMASKGLFYGIVIMPDGDNNVTVSFYDNASAASGTEFLPTMTFAGNGGPQAFSPPYPIPVYNGIYIDITTVGTVKYIIQREPER